MKKFLVLLVLIACALYGEPAKTGQKVDSISSPPYGETGDGRIKMPEGTKERMEAVGETFIVTKPTRASNVTPAFVLDTQNPDSVDGKSRPNDGDAKPVFKKSYSLTNPARVQISIQKNDTLIRLISDENRKEGTYIYHWDGFNEAGVKMFGEYEGVIKVIEKSRADYFIRHKIKVTK